MAGETDFLDKVDKSKFTTEGYVKRVPKPWGYELLLIADGGPYMSKIMHINAGCRQSVQVHDAKSETYLVIKGKAAVLIETSDGEMIQVELKPETGYTTQVGQRHRLIGLTDCDVLEASTPEIGTTWRLEDDYKRPDETEALRADPNRGWKE
jgi:mannose-6-phosphate isomerase-like protein (cupin superfamily)